MVQWCLLITPDDEARANPKSYHTGVMWGEKMMLYGGEGTEGTSSEIYSLTFAECTQAEIDEAEKVCFALTLLLVCRVVGKCSVGWVVD